MFFLFFFFGLTRGASSMQLLIMTLLQISKGHFPLNLPPVPVKVASKSILVMLLHLNILKQPSVTDPVKPDPVDFIL